MKRAGMAWWKSRRHRFADSHDLDHAIIQTDAPEISRAVYFLMVISGDAGGKIPDLLRVIAEERMRYADFKKRGLFVGSGVLEARCRTVIGQRLKQSGLHWTVRGANCIIALRCSIMSNKWEGFWEHRVAV